MQSPSSHVSEGRLRSAIASRLLHHNQHQLNTGSSGAARVVVPNMATNSSIPPIAAAMFTAQSFCGTVMPPPEPNMIHRRTPPGVGERSTHCILHNMTITGATLHRCHIISCTLIQCVVEGGYICSTGATQCSFTRVNLLLSCAITSSQCTRCDLTNCPLSQSTVRDCRMLDSQFSKCSIIGQSQAVRGRFSDCSIARTVMQIECSQELTGASPTANLAAAVASSPRSNSIRGSGGAGGMIAALSAAAGGGGGDFGLDCSIAAFTALGCPTTNKQRITRMFRKYVPQRVGDVAVLLRHYVGREPQLLEALVRKFGPQPKAGDAVFEEYKKTKERLVRYFKHYQATTDLKKHFVNENHLMDTYCGREEEMWKMLTGRFGKEPEVSANAAAVVEEEEDDDNDKDDDDKSKLIRFYSRYNKDKLPLVDTVLEKFKGRMPELWLSLTSKYGEIPPRTGGEDPRTALRNRVVRYYRVAAPEKLLDPEHVEKVVETYLGKEAQLFAALTTKYCVLEPVVVHKKKAAAATAADLEQVESMNARTSSTATNSDDDATEMAKLLQFYEYYSHDFPQLRERASIDHVQRLLNRYVSADSRKTMWKTLFAKYGKYPTVEQLKSRLGDQTAANERRKQQQEEELARVRRRLLRFYGTYNPQRIRQDPNFIDETIQRYSVPNGSGRNNRFEELFVALTQKYGKEPPDPELRERLVRYYTHYAPAKIAHIDKIMEVFGPAKEEELFRSLTSLYGPEPPAAAATTAGNGDEPKPAAKKRAITDAQRAAAEELAQQARFGLRLRAFDSWQRAVLLKRHSASSAADVLASLNPAAELEERCRRILVFNHPNRDPEPLLAKYRGGKERYLHIALLKKYGSEPPPPVPVIAASALPAVPEAPVAAAAVASAADAAKKEDEELELNLEGIDGDDDVIDLALDDDAAGNNNNNDGDDDDDLDLGLDLDNNASGDANFDLSLDLSGCLADGDEADDAVDLVDIGSNAFSLTFNDA